MIRYVRMDAPPTGVTHGVTHKAGVTHQNQVSVTHGVTHVADGEDDLPTTGRASPVLNIRISEEEAAAIDRMRGLKSRSAFVRLLLRAAVRAVGARG